MTPRERERERESGSEPLNPNYRLGFREKRKPSSKLWLWIVAGLLLLSGLGLGIYFFTKNSSNSPSKNPNLQYLPSEEESQAKISQIQQEKGIDQQQATIEFLTAYVPYIEWWEINSLQELDEKINLVNSRTGFPPFKEVPPVDKFNREVEGNMQKKSLMFLASVIPRASDGSIDWKSLDFMTYLTTVLQPQMEQIKFKPVFATQANYQELGRRLTQEINSALSSACSKFSALNNVSELNQLTNEYLSKIFQGYIYAENIHDELGKQLNIANHQKFKLDKTGNHSLNSGWNIALNEFAFKGGSGPDPNDNDLENVARTLNNDLEKIEDYFTEEIPKEEDRLLQEGENSRAAPKIKAIINSYKKYLQEVKQFRHEMLSNDVYYNRQKLTEIRKNIQKWNWILK